MTALIICIKVVIFLVQLQANTGLLNQSLKKLVSTLNHFSQARVLKPNIHAKFAELGESLAEYFTQSTIEITTDKTEKSQIVVYCIKLADLLDQLLLQRKIYSEHVVKLGIDGRGGFLKISLGVQEAEQPEDLQSSPRKKTLASQVAKDTSVKRQLLVAIAEDAPENYTNIQKILDLIHPDGVDFLLSCDLKLANIVCGIQSHSCSHPCTWCDVEAKKLSQKGNLRTFGSLRQCFDVFQAHGQDPKQARLFKNVIHLPLFDKPDSSLVLTFIAPMELHLLLGVVNHLFKALKEAWPKADDWPGSLRIKSQPFHGSQFDIHLSIHI